MGPLRSSSRRSCIIWQSLLKSARLNPDAVVLHAGSRLQFGRIETIPVDENHPLRPRTPYAMNKTAAENMYLFYHQIHGIRCVMFRIANPYGPRSQMRHSKYSMVNWFIRQAMDDKTIRVFGDGRQVRDYIYVDDLAEAFIRAAVTEACWGEVFNVGSGVPTSIRALAQQVLEVVGSKAEWLYKESQEAGTDSMCADVALASHKLGFSPRVRLKDGLGRMIARDPRFQAGRPE